jgi:hypothetical protein
MESPKDTDVFHFGRQFHVSLWLAHQNLVLDTKFIFQTHIYIYVTYVTYKSPPCHGNEIVAWDDVSFSGHAEHVCEIYLLSFIFHIVLFRVLWLFIRLRRKFLTSVLVKTKGSGHGPPHGGPFVEIKHLFLRQIKILNLKHIFQKMYVLFMVIRLALDRGLAISASMKNGGRRAIEVGATQSESGSLPCWTRCSVNWPSKREESNTLRACIIDAFINVFRKLAAAQGAEAASGRLRWYFALRRSRSRINTSWNFQTRFLRQRPWATPISHL